MSLHSKLSSYSGLTKAIIFIEFFLVAYMLYALSASVYKNYQIDQHIKNFEQENKKIADENYEKSNDFKYYTSDAYAEKIAKQNFGKKNPGEEVIILPKTEEDNVVMESDQIAEVDLKNKNKMSNPQKWWIFFFSRNSR
jgi:cell division protein FtsB